MGHARTTLIALPLVLLLGACAGSMQLPAPVEGEGDDEQTLPTDPPLTDTQAVTRAFRGEAQSLLNRGEVERAVDVLERALRIDQVDGESWLMLAIVEYDRGDYIQAEQKARKAAVLLPPHRLANAWHVVADALEQQGQKETARDIRRTWRL